jgi:hypothetical protein
MLNTITATTAPSKSLLELVLDDLGQETKALQMGRAAVAEVIATWPGGAPKLLAQAKRVVAQGEGQIEDNLRLSEEIHLFFANRLLHSTDGEQEPVMDEDEPMVARKRTTRKAVKEATNMTALRSR